MSLLNNKEVLEALKETAQEKENEYKKKIDELISYVQSILEEKDKEIEILKKNLADARKERDHYKIWFPYKNKYD